MSDLLYWMADNVAVWRPLAVMVLATLAGGCVWFGATAYGGDD